MADDEETLTMAVVRLASRYGRYGYRRVTAMLRGGGMESEPQAGGADLAGGRTQSASQTAQAGPTLGC